MSGRTVGERLAKAAIEEASKARRERDHFLKQVRDAREMMGYCLGRAKTAQRDLIASKQALRKLRGA